jgi:hypothetical protein
MRDPILIAQDKLYTNKPHCATMTSAKTRINRKAAVSETHTLDASNETKTMVIARSIKAPGAGVLTSG